MKPADRSAIRNAARYLREVRPLDPEEIADYVASQPHPAAVREVLREQAVELGVLEQPDGTFVPVPETPVPPLEGPIEVFPSRYDRTIVDQLVETYGADWAANGSGHELRETCRQLKEDYYRGRTVSYDRTAALAYAGYHLADNYAAGQYVLSTLCDRGLLDRSLRVLDVGAGVGGPALGLFELVGQEALIDYHALEPSPAAEILAELLDAAGPNVHWNIHRRGAESFEPDGPYDLVLFGNVLSELADPRATAGRYAESVAHDGTLLLLAPADKRTATRLRETERTVEADTGLGVYAPTARLWPDRTPANRCWSFDRRPDLAVPGTQRALDEPAGGDGEFVNVDVQYAFGVLRRDGARWLDWSPAADRYVKLAETDDHVTDRIDVAAVKLSHDLAEDGHPVFLIGDGSQTDDHFAVLARETGLNEALRTAGYGAGLSIERTLVLWNDDEAAYNLVVDDETVVDAVPAGA